MMFKNRLRSPWIASLIAFLLLPACVSQSRYRAETQALSEQLQSAQGRGDSLEKELSDLKQRLETSEAELEQTRKKEREVSDRAAVLEQQLSLANESGNKTARQLREEMIRMKGETEEELRRRNQELAALQNQIGGQTQEIGQLKAALRMTEEEASKRERELQEATKTREDLIGKLKSEIQEGSIKISQLKDRLSVEIVDKILFPSGSDEITPKGKEVLKKVSDILKGVHENHIRIEGHTDNIPIGSKIKTRFQSNWELSTSRATQVVRLLIEQGIGPENLHAVGMAEFRPVASNDSPEGRQRNRRIEIVLFPKDIQKIASAIK